MEKATIAFILLVGCVCTYARPQNSITLVTTGKLGNKQLTDFLAYITNYKFNLESTGDYQYETAASDGQYRGEAGIILQPQQQSVIIIRSQSRQGQRHEQVRRVENTEREGELAVRGYYSYVGDDGKTYAVSYTADKNGFRPVGEHLPPAADVSNEKPELGIPSAAIGSLAGGGLAEPPTNQNDPLKQ